MAFDSVLVPTDDSDPTKAAANHGSDFAEQLNATVHCFSVADGGIASGFHLPNSSLYNSEVTI